MKISVVSPVYMCATCLGDLCQRLQTVLQQMQVRYEIILVDDGSPDDSWSTIKSLAARLPHVTGLKLSRNFGQHRAIAAGLAQVSGDWIVVLDCDLQDQPEEIPKLFAKAQEGFDLVLAARLARQDSWLKRAFSVLFYRMLSFMTETTQDPAIANFGIYHRKVIDAINALPETIRYFPVLVRWVGFRSTTIEVAHAPRAHGQTSYSSRKLVRLAFDVILAFSDRPLRLTAQFGLLIAVASFTVGVWYFAMTLTGEYVVAGWPTLVISIWLLSGIIIFTLGIVGLYVGKTFELVKARPVFIIGDIAKSSLES